MDKERTFDPATYAKQFYVTPTGEMSEVDLQIKFNQWCKEAFEIVPPCQDAIQIGCGPVLVLSAFASRKISKIYLTEYNVDSFKFIQAWMNKQNNQYILDWSRDFKAIAKLQGTTENIEERLRKAVVGCLKIDLDTDQIFEYPFFKKVDMIISRLCVESAAKDNAYFKRVFKNLKKYLKKNGHILFLGILQETYYIVGKQRLPCLYVTKQLLQETMKENGFEVIKLDCYWPENPPTQFGDWKGLFSLLAKLPNDQKQK